MAARWLHLHVAACSSPAAAHIRVVKFQVIVTPKAAVLDPQGAAVRDAMQHLGMPEVRSVRIGKFLEIDVNGDRNEIEPRLHDLCRDLLSNPVIEDYRLEDQPETTEDRKP
ncbi:hypothetical protein BH18VER1_BH18VER1_01450 [soil metagenome]